MPLAWGLVAVVALILALTWLSLQLQVTLAGFLNGESVWSKAQKQAVIDLKVYASTGDVDALTRFRRDREILQDFRFGRDQIAAGDYDHEQVAQAFAEATTIPEAIPGAIFLLDHFSWAPYLREALDAWYSVDGANGELAVIAEELEEKYATSGQLEQAQVASILDRIGELNRFIGPRADRFSRMTARGASWVGHILMLGVLVIAIVACLIWLQMARRILAGIRGTEQRYQLLFDSAGDGIVMVDDNDGRIVAANQKLAAWLGRSQQELSGTGFADMFSRVDAHSAASVATGVLQDGNGGERAVELQSSVARIGGQTLRQTIIRDITERLAMEQERRIASEAMASIAEGVIIADADHRITSVNAAHYRITGHTSRMVFGNRIEDMRVMPDGSALPHSIWDTVENGESWLGELRSRRADGSSFPELLSLSAIRDSEGRVSRYVGVITDITEAKSNQARLEHLAHHDVLTGLLNRMAFERRCAAAIAEAARTDGAMAVLFIDLDAFKSVNDSYSHRIGDQLLSKLAKRIVRAVGPSDVAGRIGGDEFTVVVGNLHNREEVAGMVNRLLIELARPIAVEDYEVALTASIGVAGYPNDGADPATLIANADAAMYVAKSEERNTFRFYHPDMQANSRERLELAVDLRHALDAGEFQLVYQPGIELRTGRIIGAEALLRWRHPRRGEILPELFVPVAESLGLIRRIDQWVMTSVCKQLRSWNDSGMPRLKIAVNVSATSFSHPGFVAEVRRAMEAHGVAPQQLVLEITEGTILRLGDTVQQTLQALNELDMEVAIDDFGTGYSSLAYLKLPAITCLKIDRSFVAGLPNNMNDVAIVEAIMALADSMQLRTIAEGIETDAQHEFLLRVECFEGQGYLYARPLGVAELERMLRPNTEHLPVRLRLVPGDPKR